MSNQLREELIMVCKELDVPVIRSHTNFVYLPIGARSGDLVAACERSGVLVRATGGGVRVSVGTATENDQFRSALAAWAMSSAAQLAAPA